MSKSKAHQICSAGGVELVIGRGPPILTANHEVIDIGGEYWLLERNFWKPSTPVRARATWIDLTRRSVRFQVIGGREVLYDAEMSDQGGGRTVFFVFSSTEHAFQQAIADAKRKVKQCEDEVDTRLKAMADAKQDLARIEAAATAATSPAGESP